MTVDRCRPARYVAHLMGMPVSLALRGRHADDARRREAWERCVAELHRGRPGVQHLPRGLRRSRASAAARSTWPTARPRSTRCWRSGSGHGSSRGGAFDVRRPGPDGVPTLDPSGVVKGWAVQRASAHLRALPDTDVVPLRGRRHGLPRRRRLATRLAGRHRGPARPAAAASPPSRYAAARSRRPAPPTGASTSPTPAPAALPGAVASVTVLADDLTWADIDATAAYAMDADALTWLRGRPGRRGVVVWRDGASDLFDTTS